MTKQYEYRGISFVVPAVYRDGYGNDLYRPTLTRIKNLIDMAAAIRKSPPPEFNMDTYCSMPNLEDDDWDKLEKLKIYDTEMEPKEFFKAKDVLHGTCGTSACAIGTAAYNGIGKAHLYDSWGDYADKAFGLHSGRVWDYVFDQYWSGFDNTAEGAAARILHLVIDGPKEIDYHSMNVKSYEKFKEVVINDQA